MNNHPTRPASSKYKTAFATAVAEVYNAAVLTNFPLDAAYDAVENLLRTYLNNEAFANTFREEQEWPTAYPHEFHRAAVRARFDSRVTKVLGMIVVRDESGADESDIRHFEVLETLACLSDMICVPGFDFDEEQSGKIG